MQALLCSAAGQLMSLLSSSSPPPRLSRTLRSATHLFSYRPNLPNFPLIKTLFPSAARVLPSFSPLLLDPKRKALVNASGGLSYSDEESERAKLVQASANTILSHFLGLVFSLELLRSVTLPNLEALPVPKAA